MIHNSPENILKNTSVKLLRAPVSSHKFISCLILYIDSAVNPVVIGIVVASSLCVLSAFLYILAVYRVCYRQSYFITVISPFNICIND